MLQLKNVKKILFTPNNITGIISDYNNLDEIQKKYPTCKFIKVEND